MTARISWISGKVRGHCLRLRAIALALRGLRLRAIALALRGLRLRAIALALRGPRLQLERSPHREFEVTARLVNRERCSANRPGKVLIDSGWVKREIYAEWRVENRHHNLKFDTGAHTQARIGSRQELRR